MECSSDDCGRNVHARGLCHKHYKSELVLRKKNGLFEEPTVSRIVMLEDHAEIILCDRKRVPVAVAKIDKKDVPKCSGARWYLCSGYVLSRTFGPLHRYILGVKSKSKEVDHIDGNPLDNRRLNLRRCNRFQNCQNSSRPINNRSGIKNVHWVAEQKRWRVKIRAFGKDHVLGIYKDLSEAARVAEKFRNKLHGRFATER